VIELAQVILGVRDLEAATSRVRALGLEVVDGGLHPGLGTANRIVPLGRQYLELLGVVDRAAAERSDYGRALLRRIEPGDRLVRWSLRTDRIDDVASRLGLQTERRGRVRPDGVRLSWRAAGLAVSLERPWLPFFVQWDDEGLFPGVSPAVHACGAARIGWLEVRAGDAAMLTRWTAGASAPLRSFDGEPGLRQVGLAAADGTIVAQLP
jgi:hypothetical protein